MVHGALVQGAFRDLDPLDDAVLAVQDERHEVFLAAVPELQIQVLEDLRRGGVADGVDRLFLLPDPVREGKRRLEAGRLRRADPLHALQLDAGGVGKRAEFLELDKELPPQVERAAAGRRIAAAKDKGQQFGLTEGSGAVP